mgnify:CR=1 FL=1
MTYRELIRLVQQQSGGLPSAAGVISESIRDERIFPPSNGATSGATTSSSTLSMGTVTTLAAGLSATATLSDGIINLGIPNGATGATGNAGLAGSQGEQGPAGTNGTNGTNGSDGSDGADGATGAAGATGAQGPQGIQGATGPAGADGNDGSDGATGPQGPQGIGVAGPAGPAGNDGADGADGAAGAQGIAGDVGATGPAGATGAAGSNGSNGTDGNDGATGPAGPAGPEGPAGPAGAGVAGPQGPAGADGSDGSDGAAGAAGATGATGAAGADGADSVTNMPFQQHDKAVGWWTFAIVKGRDQGYAQRAMAQFYVRDTDSGRHRAARIEVGHHFGRDGGNQINLLSVSGYGGGVPFTKFRLVEGNTYDGAALQVYISNSTNRLDFHMMFNLQTGNGWTLLDNLIDTNDPAAHDAFLGYVAGGYIDFIQSMAAVEEINLEDLIVPTGGGGMATTGSFVVQKDFRASGGVIQTDNAGTLGFFGTSPVPQTNPPSGYPFTPSLIGDPLADTQLLAQGLDELTDALKRLGLMQ